MEPGAGGGAGQLSKPDTTPISAAHCLGRGLPARPLGAVLAPGMGVKRVVNERVEDLFADQDRPPFTNVIAKMQGAFSDSLCQLSSTSHK